MASRDVNWIDGLRGCASFIVVAGHLCTSFVPHLHAPANVGESPELFQLPFLRLCVGGRSAVAIFFLVTGYVNSMGPIKRARAGNTDAALNGLSRSALSRTGRLVLPASLSTFISWLFCHTGVYTLAKRADAPWIRQGAPPAHPTVYGATYDLIWSEIRTWAYGENEYDGTQWTLILFLEGSMIVYTTLLATVHVKPAYRKGILIGLYIYSWISGMALKSMNIYTGMLLAELHADLGSDATSLLPRPVPVLMMILGLFLCGYPQDAPERAPWSSVLYHFGSKWVPHNGDLRRYWDHIGASTLLFGVFFSATARKILTQPFFNFLGRVSFPVYLIHNQLIKTILVFMVYGAAAIHQPLRMDEDGKPIPLQRGGIGTFLIAIPAFYWFLYGIAHLWSKYVDPMCGKITNWAMNRAYGRTETTERKPLPS
ncbi:MAG: hypothetical protein M4579_007209 [Chaenotheca gracillima]|nr:MAG: hypothetical protein M4579_007209 [Chaenotheca gracillima]